MATVKSLPARNWDSIAELWLQHLPPDMQAYENNTIEQLLRLESVSLSDKAIIQHVPNLRETAFFLSCLLRRKAAYCFTASKSMNEQGYPTGAAIIMYDACFYSAKALIYLLGIVDAGRDSKYYIDLFYQEPVKKGGRLADVGHQLFQLGERLTHNMVWNILARLLNTLSTPEELEQAVKQLRRNKYDNLSKERNRLLYTPHTWSRQENLGESDLYQQVSYIDNIRFFNEFNGSFSSEYHDPYNRGAVSISSFYDGLFAILGDKSPAGESLFKSFERLPIINNFEFIKS